MQDEEFEFRRRDRPPVEEDPARQEETSFSENLDRSIMWGEDQVRSPDPPTREPGESVLQSQRKELESLRETEKLRAFLDEALKTKTYPDAGPFSKELYKSAKLVENKKSGKTTGVEFLGFRVVVKGGAFSTSASMKTRVQEFQSLLEKAQQEYEKTTDSDIEESMGAFNEQANETTKQDFSEDTDAQIQKYKDSVKDFLNRKEQEAQTLQKQLKILERTVQQKEQKEEEYQAEIQQKERDISKLTQELGKQAIQHGKELSEQKREKEREIKNKENHIRQLENQLRKEEAQKTGNTDEEQVRKLQEKQDRLEERLASAKLSLRQAEDENEQLLQMIHKNKQSAMSEAELKDKTERLQSEKKTLENELFAERASRLSAQDQIEEQGKLLAEAEKASSLSPREIDELNSTIEQKILDEEISPQQKIYRLEAQQKYWLKKAEKEANPEIKPSSKTCRKPAQIHLINFLCR